MSDQDETAQQAPETLVATVFLRSISGRSALRAGPRALTNPRPYLPDPEAMERAIAELEQLGFTIEARGMTLSISGPPSLFEQTSGASISFEATEIAGPGRRRARTLYVARSSEPVMRIKGLEDDVEGVVLATPGVPFHR